MTLPRRLDECVSRIAPVDPSLYAKAMAHIDVLTKPKGSLGRLEEMAARLFAVQNGATPLAADPARVVTVAADHGVAEEGVSTSPSIVTRQQVRNFINGGGGISVLTRANGIGLQVVDAGVAGEDFAPHPLLVRKKIASGTANITGGPAMRMEECLDALDLGISLAERARAEGIRCLGTGEMGIANTTPSTALFSALYGLDPASITGPGTGLSEEGVRRKAAVIQKALDANAGAVKSKDPIAVLAALGGLEIAALAGLILGGAALRVPLVIDGFISTAACAVALAIAPQAKDYCFFSHASAEPGHEAVMAKLGERPLVDLGFRLGEGTGAVFGMLILRSAAAMFNEMATFSGAGVSGGS
jgi:nicotinate-nucleotide--dimethylbenzimidazole phosphoribosyltransferase